MPGRQQWQQWQQAGGSSGGNGSQETQLKDVWLLTVPWKVRVTTLRGLPVCGTCSGPKRNSCLTRPRTITGRNKTIPRNGLSGDVEKATSVSKFGKEQSTGLRGCQPTRAQSQGNSKSYALPYISPRLQAGNMRCTTCAKRFGWATLPFCSVPSGFRRHLNVHQGMIRMFKYSVNHVTFVFVYLWGWLNGQCVRCKKQILSSRMAHALGRIEEGFS